MFLSQYAPPKSQSGKNTSSVVPYILRQSKIPSCDINDLNPDFIVSLHCNAYNGSASGTEVLYHHRSAEGKLMAELLNARLVNALGLRNRGIKAKNAEDRGGYLLVSANAPRVIAEPFFIDNYSDLIKAKKKRKKLIKAYVLGIQSIASSI